MYKIGRYRTKLPIIVLNKYNTNVFTMSFPVYNANQVADWFIANTDYEAGDTLSHLKLQKLLYYAQAWHYTIHSSPLIGEPFEAWMHGPVVRSVYDRFRDTLPYSAIDGQSIELNVPGFPPETEAILQDVKTIYGEHSGAYLENLTHSEDPWKIARGGLPNHVRCDKEITLESMKEYYSKLNVEE